MTTFAITPTKKMLADCVEGKSFITAIRLLKDKYPDIAIYTDVALDPYSSDEHDGIVREDGLIMNDETVHQLCKQAVSQTRAGADVVSPSDMMDGRVGSIRAALDAEGFHDVSILIFVHAVSALKVLFPSLNSPSQLNGWTANNGDPCEKPWQGITCSGSAVTAIESILGVMPHHWVMATAYFLLL